MKPRRVCDWAAKSACPLRVVVYAEVLWLNDMSSSELLEEHSFLLVQRAWHDGGKQ
jgi:hypothetical protein